MKHVISCCALFLLVVLVGEAHADLPFYNHTNLVEIELNPNQKFGSKPSYFKFAGVTFITDSDANRFKFDSADVRTQCMALGFAYLTDSCEAGTAKALCSSVLNQAGAEKYTSGCCNRKYYLYEDNNKCSNNNTIESCTTSSGKTYYHCGCNRSLYPFSGDSDCPRGNVANMANVCEMKDESNENVKYYATCCPASYQETCTGDHLVGNGSACYREEGESLIAKYESCSCSAHYDTICAGSGMIDPSDFCLLNGKKFTKDTNCEGLCQQTSQTNVDAEFYNKIWHCLYKEDGATIKTPELEKHLCTKNGNEYYYQTCESQGYQKSEADCFNKDIILRCPQDTSKVWCLDSKYCTGYDVALDDADYMTKARVEKCPSTDQGHRYRYIEPDCNDCWDNGKYDGTKCSNKDTSAKGDSNHCCRLGYVMNNNGICVKNSCNKTQYPYSQHPLTDIGEVETCYEGNPNASTDYSLMYNPYYGYASCKSDFTQGEMWQQDDTNPRKCVCVRENSEQNWYLPYGNDEYKEANGFNVGIRGESINCTDNDSSYYGYKRCYRGSAMDISIPGKCNDAEAVGYTVTYGYGDGDMYWENLTPTLSGLGYSVSSECIARYKHYQAMDGTKLGDESVKTMLVSGCDRGDEQECNQCHSVSNLAKEKKNGLYTVHGMFDLRVNFAGGRTLYGMFTCPTLASTGGTSGYDFKPTTGRTMCYKHCKLSDLSKCYTGDVLVDDSVGYGNIKIAIIAKKSGTTLMIQPYKGSKSGQTWDEAMAWAASFYPGIDEGNEKYKNHPIFGQGKWALPTTANNGVSDWRRYMLQSVLWAEGLSGPFLSSGIWLSTTYGDQAYFRDTYVIVLNNKSVQHNAVPIMFLTY